MAIHFQRRELLPFIRRLTEPRQFLQVLAGPRQVGKTTLVRQALMGAIAVSEGFGFQRLRSTPELWGRSNTVPLLHYWHDAVREVDFLLHSVGGLFAIEVKSGRLRATLPGLDAFCRAFPGSRPLVVGTGALDLETWFNAQ